MADKPVLESGKQTFQFLRLTKYKPSLGILVGNNLEIGDRVRIVSKDLNGVTRAWDGVIFDTAIIGEVVVRRAMMFCTFDRDTPDAQPRNSKDDGTAELTASGGTKGLIETVTVTVTNYAGTNEQTSDPVDTSTTTVP